MNTETFLKKEHFPCVAGHNNIVYGSVGTLYKMMKSTNQEYEIYRYLEKNHLAFCKLFVPKLFGVEGSHNNLLKLEDVTYEYKNAHVMDIKVGARKQNKKHTFSHFSLKGFTCSDKFEFDSKKEMTINDIKFHLSNFLMSHPYQNNCVANWINLLKNMVEQLKTINLKLNGNSILLIYDETSDKSSDKTSVYLVDFNRSEISNTCDNNVISSIRKVIEILESLL